MSDTLAAEGLEVRIGQQEPLFARSGELVLVTGPAGCGKSYFLRFLAGLIVLDENVHCSLDGVSWPDIKAKRHWVRMRMDSVPPLWLGQRVDEELCFGLNPKSSVDVMRHALDRWGLKGVELSDALAQLDRLQEIRLTLAAISLATPKLVLLDNPSASLPLDEAERLRDEIVAWARETRCVVLVACSRWQEWQPAVSQIWRIASRGEWPQRMETEVL